MGDRARLAAVASKFKERFGSAPEGLFSAPGRTELGGNHTDHQHGRVLAAAVNAYNVCAAGRNDSGVLRLVSEGYDPVEITTGEYEPRSEERNTTAALVRGIAAELGVPAGTGADILVSSGVPGGSGLSSSAAFEVLLAVALDSLVCGGARSPIELAIISQRVENVYFGKPCGLMDQAASAVGGVVAMDFKDPEAPVIEPIPFNLKAAGYALCLVDSGSDHADLTDEYASIPAENSAVCALFGKAVLRELSQAEFMSRLPQVREICGDRAALRALHFFSEDRRASDQANALRCGNFQEFLRLVRQSGHSSALYLQNVTPAGQVRRQELLLTIAVCEQILGGRGAARVHGGGFGGAAQAFVPLDMLDEFIDRADSALGAGRCRVLDIRAEGGTREELI